jgi:uncharacterized membrane protein YhiD involved in acid resistance
MPAFPPIETATKPLLSLGIGLLVFFEREWSHKDLGVRTFAITSLFGMLAALIAPAFILAVWQGSSPGGCGEHRNAEGAAHSRNYNRRER